MYTVALYRLSFILWSRCQHREVPISIKLRSAGLSGVSNRACEEPALKAANINMISPWAFIRTKSCKMWEYVGNDEEIRVWPVLISDDGLTYKVFPAHMEVFEVL